MQSDDTQSDKPPLNARVSRRHRRANALRRRALSPLRILIMVLFLPISTAIIAVGVFLRVTDYDRNEAVVHLIALAGCDASAAIGLGPFRKGYAGYHPRNDPDGDGVACGSFVHKGTLRATAIPPQTRERRPVGGAKFVRPAGQ